MSLIVSFSILVPYILTNHLVASSIYLFPKAILSSDRLSFSPTLHLRSLMSWLFLYKSWKKEKRLIKKIIVIDRKIQYFIYDNFFT